MPSTRSKSQLSRATNLEQTAETAPEEGPSTNANASKQPPHRDGVTSSSLRENTTGLPIFPDELLLEILSYYPDTKLEPDEESIGVNVDKDAHFARRETLKALSQTCRNLRRFLRPYVWRRIEAFPGMLVSSKERVHTEQQVALELIRQLEIVSIRDPLLAGYVNVVNVQTGSYCIRNVFRELARCLAIFPNVHTLKLYATIDCVKLERAITYGFGHHKPFPQIRSIIISQDCYGLLKYCPGVRYIYGMSAGRVLNEYESFILADCCPLMENICLRVPSLLGLPLVVQQFPNIRDISLRFADWREAQTDLDFIFSKFQRLKVIRMHLPLHIHLVTCELFISQAKETLLGLQKSDKEEKTLILYMHSQPRKTITLAWPPTFRL